MLNNIISKASYSAWIVAMVAVLMLSVFVRVANAVPTYAGLTLGDARPSQTTTYTISLSTVAATGIQCITVDLEAGDATDAALQSASLVTAGSWTDASTANQLVITAGTPQTPSDNGAITWSGIDNGSTPDVGYTATYTSYTGADCSTGLVETANMQYIYTEGTTVSLTVDPTFTFTVAGVASASSVNSATTNVSTTATTVPFGVVSTSTNGIAAQDLSITSNAQNGFFIYMRQTQPLTNALSDTIDDVSDSNSCTYSTPASFSAAGTEAFGFTTNSTAVASGNYIANNWCDVTTSSQTVASSGTAPSSGVTTRVGYQAGIAAATPQGTYTNTLVYTAVPIY